MWRADRGEVLMQPVLDLFEEPREAVVPCCGKCGATGDRIEVDGVAVRDLRAAALWALIAIGEHEREMHGASS